MTIVIALVIVIFSVICNQPFPYVKTGTVGSETMIKTWREEWTLASIQATYDSIATLEFDGAEEYILHLSRLILI